MQASRATIRISSVALLALLGEGRINAASFRRSKIDRSWPCGCVVNYAFDHYDDAEWIACAKHAPGPPGK